MIIQSANYNNQLSSFSAESTLDNQFTLYDPDSISNWKQDGQEAAKDLGHPESDSEKQWMADVTKELSDLRQQLLALQGK